MRFTVAAVPNDRARTVFRVLPAQNSLIAEVESAIASGSADKRVDTLRRITDLFMVRPDDYSDDQIEVFDDVIARLAVEIEAKARAELARRLAPVNRAPVAVIRKLALDQSIEVAEPVLRQSEAFPHYRSALEKLQDLGLVYPAYLTRTEIKRFVKDHEEQGSLWPRDPDGAPLYPGDDAVLSEEEIQQRSQSDAPFALRLDMKAALSRIGEPLTWQEYGAEGPALFEPAKSIAVDPAAWGDVVLARKDTPTSYHLSVIVDDARQGITDVLRGQDLYAATSVHRVLQHLLDLPEPRYRHHRLILGDDGRKLSKSNRDTSLRSLREAGVTHPGLRKRIGL